MLQPREQSILRPFLTILCILLACIQNGFAQYSDDVYIVEPTPALRLTNQGDLTTVLLLNNNNRGTHGRYLNVKPTVGLLTSTARTFIQEGVTTEYATQVLGTTLDNGRLYAQLLKKSSRVLYDKESSPTVISPTSKFPGTVQTLQTFSPNPKSLLQSHNDIIGDQDWQLIDDHLLSVNKQSYNNLNTFVRNTDFVSPNDSPQRYSALLVFPTQSYNNAAIGSNGNFGVGENFPNQTFSVSHSSSSSSSSSGGRNNIAAQKVLHAGDLPTFTIKNMFAPSGFSWDSPIDDEFVDQQTERISKVRTEQLRAPKLLQHNNRILNNELRNLPTVTYYGFADFTTIVGDTVIVFSPSTSAASGNQGQVTSIKGEATLNNSPLETAFNPSVAATHQLIEPTFTVQHTVATIDRYTPPPPSPTSPETPTIHQHDESEENDDDQDQFDLTMPEDSDDDSDDGNSDEEYSTTTEQESVGDDTTSKIDEINETTEELATVVANQIDLEPSIVGVGVGETQTSLVSIDATATATSTPTLLSKPSNEDISKIFASLASAEAAKKMAAQSSAALQQEKIATTPPTSTIDEPFVRVDDKNSERTAKDIESIDETTTINPATESNLIVEISSEKQDESSTNAPNENVGESAEKPQEKPQQIESVIESIEPETKISGGVTTIFFEDDPFQAFEATPTQQLIVPTVTTTTPETVTEAIVNDDNDDEAEITTIEPDTNVTESNVDESVDESCEHRTSEITPSLVPKTLTYLTTFFISDADETSTSIESNVVVTFDVSYSTKFSCADEIEPTPLVKQLMTTVSSEADSMKSTVEEEPTTGEPLEVVSTTPENVDEVTLVTTPRMIVTEKAHVTTEESTVTEANSTDKVTSSTTGEDYEDDGSVDDDDSQQSDEEIELIYKTLYTTYTYLTTFFHESTTSVSSRTEILTNVISSTVDPSILHSDLGVTQLLSSISPTARLDQVHDSMATSVGVGRPTTRFQVQQSDLVQIDDILREDEEHVTPTVSLDDQQVQTNGVKTYYTTYTYFTTIFVDGETEITSRTEIYTNFVTGSGSSTRSTVLEEDKLEYTVREDDNNVLVDITPTSIYETIQKTSVAAVQESPMDSMIAGDVGVEGASVVESSFVSSSSSSNADENQITMVTDVRSSSSDGDRHIIENINKQWNGFLEDQISSESNTDEILPSSTLLLQTSYTTFTYFTTMYIGNTASNILSRLETVTNVVTETLQPTQTINADDSSLPITYFTTFTYWTTLYKDGEITTISREETVSNVVTPTTSLESIVTTEVIQPSTTVESVAADETAIVSISAIGETESVGVIQSIVNSTAENNNVNITSSDGVTKTIEPTTFYTTYTYFTTSYVGEETVLNSRFKTVTNIVTPIPELTSIGDAQLAPTVSVGNVNATPIVDETITEPPTPAPILDSQIIGLNDGKIVDAEGISTLFYTTKTIATRINNELTEIVESSSSLNIDEVKRALSTSEVDPASRTYKTGLVRLIDGTMVANRTTTLYQSKVIGTVIEGRYAQIIESTSSFLIEKTISPSTAHVDEIAPSTTQSPTDSASLQTAFNPTPSADAVQGSISDGTEEKDEQFEDSDDDDDEDEEDDGSVDENGRPKSRLTFQTKKRTFTPVIRPFASRNRPQFAPKRKNAAPGSATIITRSDFTPTITATPALKSDSSRGRFSSNRKSSSAVLNSSNASAGGSRKFSRSRSSSSGGGFASSSAFPGGSSRKGASSARIQPTSSYFGLSSRRGGVSSQRSSGSNSVRGGFSSVYAGNSRLRIKPTSTVPGADSGHLNTNVYTTQEPDAEEENATQTGVDSDNNPAEEEESDVEVTTESSRRQNPLLRFRRPQIAGRNLAVSQRRNPLTPRPKTTAAPTTTTTAKPRPRSFQRPPIATFQSRPRPASNLFPPRGLFRPQAINQDLDEGKKQPDEEGNDFGDDLDGEYDDDDDEEDDDEELERNRRDSSKKGNRVKRQAISSFRNRFRRPTPAAKNAADERADTADEEPATQRSRTTARYSAARNSNKKPTQSSGSNSRIRPTKASTSSRAQFTLREKDTATKSSRASSFRRPTTSGLSSARRPATTKSRPKAPRLKSFANAVTESTYTSRSTAGRSRQPTSRGRSTTRSRSRTTEYQNNDLVLPVFDGTITVTHHIPTEITIPVVNGQVTEYKNVVTAQVRTEVLAPNQYNTLIDRTGSSLLVLTREESTINNNGATEVTQFILHETPTTSVIFTPTTIRGRRTSFSHIIPSTVYDVENVVSTIQPQIAAQAPLANILLSQLLLGNLGGLQQQQLNPLIGLGGQQQQQQGPATPTTEFKTRTTTYVTTVTNAMSTVIPLTFRGKEILTTIVDSSVNVITATEFITDTIVVTPTMAAVQQVNSLLLPLLLQQQAQGQLPGQNSLPQPQQLSNDPLLNNAAAVQQQNLFQDANYRGDLDSNRIQKVNLDDFRDVRESEEFPEQEALETPRSRKRHHRKGHKQAAAVAAAAIPSPTLETSVVTLYVSGRRPGEFSTVLSTVVGQDSTLRKRHAAFVPVEKSAIVDYDDLYNADESEIKEYLLPATNDIGILSSSQLPAETQSLESIVGDVSRWFESQSDTSIINRSPITTTTTAGAIDKTTTQVSVGEQQSENQHFLV